MSSEFERRHSRVGVWRRDRQNQQTQNLPSQITVRGQVYVRWRFVTAILMLILALMLLFFLFADAFYVRGVTIEGNVHVSNREITALADVAGLHIFWVSTEAIRDNLINTQSIADVQVSLHFPPDMVHINVLERQPALVWQEENIDRWIDVQGNVMPARIDQPDLIRIVSEGRRVADVSESGDRLSTDIVHGALQLHELLPEIPEFRYNPALGLGFRNADGVDIWFGVGLDMADKMILYEQLRQSLQSRDIQVREISVADPFSPRYTLLTDL